MNIRTIRKVLVTRNQIFACSVRDTNFMIERGENITNIQTPFGHASPTVPLNVYAHLMKKTYQEAARGLELAVFGANRDQNEKGGHGMNRKPPNWYGRHDWI